MLNQSEFMKRVGSAGICVRSFGMVLAIALLSGCYQEYRDSNVQSFGQGEAVVLNGKQLYLTFARRDFDEAIARNESKIIPLWGSPPFYYRLVTEQPEFHVDTADHEIVDFSASDPFMIPGSDDPDFPSFFEGVHIGSDGTISSREPGLGNGNLMEHFSTVQLSLLPIDATVEGAVVTYGVLPDVLVVTYENVSGSSVQCIMVRNAIEAQRFPSIGPLSYDDIVITYREVSENTRAGVVGVSWESFRDAPPEYMTQFLAEFNASYGANVNLAESTDTESGGYTAISLP